jgi:hypothetical protein
VRGDIEYAIVALGLSATEITGVVKDATGETVDPQAGKFLEALDGSQMESIWERISENPRWKKT